MIYLATHVSAAEVIERCTKWDDELARLIWKTAP